MSATVVTTHTRIPIADLQADCADGQMHDADLTRKVGQCAPGQLWERVAEASERTFRNVWRGGMTRGRPVCIAATGYKGSNLGRHVCGDHHSHGIIRAGERVK